MDSHIPISIPPTTSHIAMLLQSLTMPTPKSVSSISQTLYIHLQASCIEPLLQILFTHPKAPVRNLAARLLRQHQTDYFHALPSATLVILTEKILGQLFCESLPSTLRAIISFVRKLSVTNDKLIPLFSPVLFAILSSPDPSFRAQAFLLLGLTTKALEKGLQDPDACVRHEAMTAYADATLRPNPGVIRLLPMAIHHARTTSVADEGFLRVNGLIYEVLTNLSEFPEFSPHLYDAFIHAVRAFSTGHMDAASPAVEFLVFVCEKKSKTIKRAALHETFVMEACRIILTNPIDVRNNSEDHTGSETRVYLAMRALDVIAMNPEFSFTAFLLGYGTVTKRIADADSRTLIGCFSIIEAICDGCSAEITSNAKNVMMTVLSLQYEDRMDEYARSVSLDVMASVIRSLNTNEMSDEDTGQIAKMSLATAVKGLRHQGLRVRRAACLSLQPVLALFRSEKLGQPAEEVADALVALDGSLAEEAILAMGGLAENASDAFVTSDRFQVLLRATVEIIVTMTTDDITNTAFNQVAFALVKVCRDAGVVNRLAEHVAQGLESDDPTVKESAFAFFGQLADSVGGSSVLLYGERVLKSAIESINRMEISLPHGEENPIDMNRVSTMGKMNT